MSVAAAMLLGVLGTLFVVLCVVLAILFVLQIVGTWKIFTKAGEKGWKSIIPIYNLYVLIKLTWEKKFFWIMLVLGIFMGICDFGLSHGCKFAGLPIIYGIAALVMLILTIIGTYRMCKAYGHAGGWTVGFILLPTIFTLMLGFGKSQYQGNVYLEQKN